MARLALRGAVLALASALATACLGGQTGQPDSLECDDRTLAPNHAWQGTTVAAAAQAFVGNYVLRLAWQQQALAAPSNVELPLDDELMLSIAYPGASATDTTCGTPLRVPVTLTLMTSASGIAESGAGTLSLTSSSGGLSGLLDYRSPRMTLSATLRPLSEGVAPSGGFDALDPQLPGASAKFEGVP